jgi:hypothetical protein
VRFVAEKKGTIYDYSIGKDASDAKNRNNTGEKHEQ